MSLTGKNILLGVSGSVAAYKAADVCSRLGKLGAETHVILTGAASQFVGPATFRALTRNPVLSDLFDEPLARRIAHIDLAQSADIVLVAPASADVIAKMAHGIADDLLTTCLLATPSQTPLLVAPAMNTVMWEHPATVANVATLRSRGVGIVEPAFGLLACQDMGIGKLAEPEEIVRAVVERLTVNRDLDGVNVLITAGATREPIDPVRFLTNRSSGKMGFALAAEAAARGANVTVVAGHTSAAAPNGAEIVRVETAREMLEACERLAPVNRVVIAAAAVADYEPVEPSAQKLKKSGADGELVLRLRQTRDVVGSIAKAKRADQIVVGFAAETDDLLVNARTKLHSKRLDLIVANDVSRPDSGFDSDSNVVTLLWPDGKSEPLPELPKREVAARILDAIVPLLTIC